jgi:hypothetical protein
MYQGNNPYSYPLPQSPEAWNGESNQSQRGNGPNEDERFSWERYFSEDDNAYYYYNPISNEIIWENEMQPQEQTHNNARREISREEAAYFANSDTSSLKAGINDSNLSVVDRSNIMLQSKNTKLLKLQQQKLDEELQSIQAPKLTKMSKSIHRTVDDMLAWDVKRKQKIAQRAQAQAELQQQEYTAKPVISRKAEQLYQQAMGNDLVSYSSPGGGGEQDYDNNSYNMNSVSTQKSLVNRLMEYDEKKKWKLEQMREEERQKQRKDAIPRINHYYPPSAHYNYGTGSPETAASTDVASRLYALAQQENDQKNQFLGQGRLESHDEKTGQRLFEVISLFIDFSVIYFLLFLFFFFFFSRFSFSRY